MFLLTLFRIVFCLRTLDLPIALHQRDQVEMEGEGLGVRKGAWSAEEDLLLTRYIRKHGEGNWHLIPKSAGLNRCRKSCRLRWLNYLTPGIKRGSFANDEIDLIIRLHKLLGNRWSLIAGRIPGRTANDVKNFWNIHIKKTQKLNYFNKKNDNLLKLEIPNKVEVIRPQARTFSKSLFFLKEKSIIIGNEDNINRNTLVKTNEITSQNQMLDHEQRNQSFLSSLKSPTMDVHITSEDISLQEGDNDWQQDLNTSHSFVPLPIHEQQSLPQLNTDWSDLFWENMDIYSLLRDEEVMF